MSRITKLVISSSLIFFVATVLFLNMSQKTESRNRFVPALTVDPNLKSTPTPKPGDTPIPGAMETLQAKIAAQRPESQYDKVTDLSSDTPLQDKYTIILQHLDGSIEAILVKPEMLEEQYKQIDPNDLIVNELPPDSSWITSGGVPPPLDFIPPKEPVLTAEQVLEMQKMFPPPPPDWLGPYKKSEEDLSEDNSVTPSNVAGGCCQIFLPNLER